VALFEITGYKSATQEYKDVVYDTSNNSFRWKDGDVIVAPNNVDANLVQSVIEQGKSNLSTVKIQMGLSCNFECDYCNQRFVPHSDETTPDDVAAFVANMPNWLPGTGEGVKFEYWGGEPFVYWKTFKPLAEAIIKQYPKAEHSVITNGSLLDLEKIMWLDRHSFGVGISHDGPGQHVRGPDPLADDGSRMAVIALYKILAPKHKVSFNVMMNSKNTSREAITDYFEEFIRTNLGEDYLQYLVIGEGMFVDAYDVGGLQNSLLDADDQIKYRHKTYNEIRDLKAKRFLGISQKVRKFLTSVESQRRLETVPQKCGMDKANNIAVDLHGNVLTCQNVSAVARNPAGIPHHIGHVSDLSKVRVDTATHWSDRAECPNCPMIHLCQGACMFLTGDLWEATCDNAYSDNVAIFANIFELITGYVPIYIDGPQRADRRDIFWWVNGRPEQTAKKIIPIVPAI